MPVGSGAYVHSLSRWRSVRLPWARFHPLPSEPDVRISRIRLSSGNMPLARGTPVRGHTHGAGGLRFPGFPEAARPHPPGVPLRRATKPVYAPAAPSLFGPAPSLSHVMLRNSPPLHTGFVGKRHSRGLSSLRHLSTPEAPFLDGHYPASPVLRASPPPCRPGLPLAGSRLPRARHRQDFPCCYAFHLPCMPAPLPRRKPAGAHVALFPARSAAFPYSQEGRLPRHPFRGLLSVHSRSGLHGRRAAQGGPLPVCFNPCRYLHEPLWPLPAGATVAGWDSHPPGKRAFPRRTEKSGVGWRRGP